ncbi:LPXTG cell wall anchor domain-containing protein [Lacticaseibacillus kribbianus]|uniref:LPXTG cell wall anchor domain-containing protein n=1 Tax=Lacticaseibacillus kribbianus TaxID=2926292 RepID=UPI001CD7B531|nr:LPXTG cell wall anchor domain-containing protein [Lacticaseibacillus kribbianus]
MIRLNALAALLLIAGLLLGSLAPEHVHAKQSVATFTIVDDGTPRPQPGPTPGGGSGGQSGGGSGGQSGGGSSGQTGGSAGGSGQTSGGASGQTGSSGQTGGGGQTDGGPPATGGETARAGNTNLPQTDAAARPAVTLGGLALLAAVAAIGVRRRARRGPTGRKNAKRRATR